MADTQTRRQEINGSVHSSSQAKTSIVKQVRYILYWENIFTSSCSLLITLMILLTFSFYPGIHATLLVLIGGYTASLLFILSFLVYCVVVGREPHNPFNVWLSEFNVNKVWILNQLSILLDLLTPHAISSLRLMFFFNPKDSITVLTILWVISYLTPYISLLEIAYAAVFILFAVPKTYEMYQEKIDKFIKRAINRIEELQKRFFGTEKPEAKTE